MKEIKLSKGFVATVSDEDFEKVSQFKWKAFIRKDTIYGGRNITVNKKQVCVMLHRFILGEDCADLDVDHKDRNGLNNTRENLRICTTSENLRNQKVRVTSKTGFKGVHFCSSTKRYIARIHFLGNKIKYLGCFRSPVDAAQKYDIAAIHYFGEFANPNFACSRLLILSQTL